MKKVMVIYGTRPEAVKVAPLIKALEASDVMRPVVVSTGQHLEMLDQVNAWFRITPQEDLKVFRDGASLTELSVRILEALPRAIEAHQPDAVVVQGDTTTVAMGAIACFYHQIPVIHLEAGLRSGDIHSPFPEEANRRLAGQVTSLHLAPTTLSRDNLLREGIDPATVAVVGNTVIDALHWTAGHAVGFDDPVLARESTAGRPMVLLTAHRRENWGEPMHRIGAALARLAADFPEHLFVFPAHKNPRVRAEIVPQVEHLANVHVTEPLDYPQFVHAQRWAEVILTDSGGVQEEAPSFGKPVLVLRENTERPEAVDAGTVKLIGTGTDVIVHNVTRLLTDPEAYSTMSRAVNPYGDGRAAERSVAAIAALLGVGQRQPDFGS